MRKWLNNYFEFSRRELNGLLILLMLVVCISIFPSIYREMHPIAAPTQEEQLAVLQFAMAQNSEFKSENSLESTDREMLPEKEKAVLFYFDPNVIGIADWQRLGLSEKQAQAILNYRAKGGIFRKKADLQKMYTLHPTVYSRLERYIQIAEVDAYAKNEEAREGNKSKREIPAGVHMESKLIELNQADTILLIEIRGIGPVFARRIIAYRDRLGGFYKKEQLLEVFGVDSLKYEEVKTQVSVDPLLLKKININTAGLTDFRNHPYIRYKQINALLEYRKQHGNYSNIADLKKVILLSAETIERLAPYLIF